MSQGSLVTNRAPRSSVSFRPLSRNPKWIPGRARDDNLIKVSISAIIIARNEAERIAKCLDSVKWADEKIVIDNGSTDETIAIAKRHGATLVSLEGRSFAALRNLGKEKAKGEWLLYVDADEIVTPELAEEIRSIAQSSELPSERLGTGRTQNLNKVAYALRRKNYYLSHPWPYIEAILRFFHKDSLIGWKGELHETAMVKGPTGELNGLLLHDTHRVLEEMVDKTNEWSEIEARHRFEAGHPPVVPWRLFRVMLTAFWDSFIRQGGWRAGVVGWIESIYQAFSIFITYAKLWELQEISNIKYQRSKIQIKY